MRPVDFGIALAAIVPTDGEAPAQAPPALRRELEACVREYLCGDTADEASLAKAVSRARGRDDLLAEIVKTKSYLAAAGPVALHGTIDERFVFVAGQSAASRGNRVKGSNDALLHGPASAERLFPLAVYVSDNVTTSG